MLSMSKDNLLHKKIVEKIYSEYPAAKDVNSIVRAVLVLVDEARANSEEYKASPALPQRAQLAVALMERIDRFDKENPNEKWNRFMAGILTEWQGASCRQ
jgi:hypothetical protein